MKDGSFSLFTFLTCLILHLKKKEHTLTYKPHRTNTNKKAHLVFLSSPFTCITSNFDIYLSFLRKSLHSQLPVLPNKWQNLWSWSHIPILHWVYSLYFIFLTYKTMYLNLLLLFVISEERTDPSICMYCLHKSILIP